MSSEPQGESTTTPPPKRPRHNMPVATEIARGAEAVVTQTPYLSRRAVIKKRLPKSYRHPVLDKKLTSRRLAQEARVLLRLRKIGVKVPALYEVRQDTAELVMEYIEGVALKDMLGGDCGLDDGVGVMKQLGAVVARMHRADIVHGDLTTGNVLVVGDSDVCLIDFGLSHGNGTDEDMAVDLYVLERAVISAHAESAQPLNDAFIEAYANEIGRPSVLTRLAEVRARGRKRDMTG